MLMTDKGLSSAMARELETGPAIFALVSSKGAAHLLILTGYVSFVQKKSVERRPPRSITKEKLESYETAEK